MANKKIRATAELFLNTKGARKDAKIFLDDLKGKLQDIENAADKMTVFKDMVNYIAQVDRALAALKASNKDAFSHMFDGLDENLKKQLEGIFGVDGAKLGQLDALRDSLSNLTLKSSINDVRAFAKELNNLFISVGKDAPFTDISKEFSNRTNATHLQRLSDELNNFATIWKDLNAQVAGGFNFGGRNSGPSTDGGVLSEIQTLVDHLEEKNKELIKAKERLDKTLEDFNHTEKNGISDNYKIDLTEESVKNLTLEYDRLQTELENADASSAGFYITLTKLIDASLKLKKAFSDVTADQKLKDTFMNAPAGGGTGDATLYARLSRYAHSKDPMNKDVQKLLDRGDLQNRIDSNSYLIEDLRVSNDINAVVQKRIALQDRLIEKIKQHSELYDKFMFAEGGDADSLDDQLYGIEKEIATLTGYTNRIDGISNLMRELGEEGERTDESLRRLYETLGMETPDAFEDRLKTLLAESRAALDALQGEITQGHTDGRASGHGRNKSVFGSDTGDGGPITAEVDFTSLENTIKAEAQSIIDKLDGNTFKVEVVKDRTEEISGSINDILGAVQQIAEHFHVDKNKTDVDNMKKNLLQLLDVVNQHNAGRSSNGEYQGQELGVALMSDGGFSVNYGDDGSVSWSHMVESLLGNLSKTLVADIHTHPLHELFGSSQMYMSDSFSGSSGDLSAFRFSKDLGAQVAGMITGNVMRLLNIGALSSDAMTKMRTELKKVEKKYVDSGLHSNYITMGQNGQIAYRRQSTLEGQHHVTELFESMMYEAFERVGYSRSDIDNVIFKKYNLTNEEQLTELATRLVQLSVSAEQAEPPLLRLSGLISEFGGDTSSNKAAELFAAYNKGEIKVSDLWNQLVPNKNYNVSEAAIQSLLNINSAAQMSPIESLLNNITTILSNINTLVGNIEASTKLNNEESLDGAIRDLLDLQAGVVNGGLNTGIKSIYNDKDATRYRYDDVESRAIDAVDELVSYMQMAKDGDRLLDSDLADALHLIEKFKTAFTYVQDLGKQRELLTGGRKHGDYIDPKTGELLGSIHPGLEGTYENLYATLTNSNGILEQVVQRLIMLKDDAYVNQDDLINSQLQVSLEELSTVVNDLKSEISRLSTELSNSGGIGGANKNDIALAVKEAIYAKDIAANYRHAKFKDVFGEDEDGNYINTITGELFDDFASVLTNFQDHWSKMYVSLDENSMFFGTKEAAIEDFIKNSSMNDMATVIVSAIENQTGQLVDAIKIILPEKESSNVNNNTFDEKEVSRAFELVAKRASKWSDNNTDIFSRQFGKPRDFFNRILNGDIPIDGELRSALKTLGMLSADGKPMFNVAKEGYRNLGVAVGEDFALPSRPISLAQAHELSPLLNEATKLGAAIPRIISYMTEADKIFELQTKVKGNNIKTNDEFLNATTEQIDGLIHTLEVMNKVGLFPDFIGDNVLFDKQRGFSLVDIETENIGWRDVNNATDMEEWFLDYIQGLPFMSSDFVDRFRERMALPADQRLVNENTIKNGKTASVVSTQGSYIDISQDIANLELLLNKVKEVAGEIRNLATEVDGIIQNLSDPFNQKQDLNNDLKVEDYDDVNHIQTIYDAENESAKKAIDDFALFYKEYSHLQDKLNQGTILMDEENPTEDDKRQILDAFDQIKQKKIEVSNSDLGTEEEIKRIRELRAEMLGLQRFMQSAWSWGSDKTDYQNRFGISDDDADFFYNLMHGPAVDDIEDEMFREYNAKEIDVHQFASHYFTDIMNGLGSGLHDFLIGHAQTLVEKAEQTDTTAELSPLDDLKAQLLEVKQAVEAKTEAFEQERLVVNSVVESEISSLQHLVLQLDEVISRINLIDDGFQKIHTNAPNAVIDQQNNGAQLDAAIDKSELDVNNIIANITSVIDGIYDCLQRLAEVLGSNMISFDKNIGSTTGEVNVADEIEKLGKLKTILSEVKNAIATKTKAFIDEGNVVGQVVGKEIAALKNLSNVVDGIVPKVNSLVEGLKSLSEHGVDVNTAGSDDSNKTSGGGTDAPPVDPFKSKLSAQKGVFTRYRNDIKDADYVTEDLEKQIDSLGVSLREVTDQPGLDAWIKRFNNLKENVQAVKSEFEQMNLGSVNLFQRELSNSFNKLTLPQREELLQEYLQAIVLLDKQKQAVKEGHAVEVSAIKDITAELQKKINAQIEANKAAKDAVNAKKKNGNFGSTVSINATAKHNSLTRTAGSEQFANSSEIAAALSQYEQAYNNMIAMRDRLRGYDVIDDSDREAFKQATTECNAYASALDKLIKNTMKLKGSKVNPDDYMLGSDFNYSDIEQRKAALADFVQQTYGLSIAAEDFRDGWNKVVFAVDNGDGTFTQMTATFTEARNEIVALAGDVKKSQGLFGAFWDELKGKFRSIGSYMIASFSFHEVWQVLRQGVNYVREIDSALTELKKVTNETDASYKNFLQDMAKTGSVIGATVKNLTTIAADWSRLGYSMEEAGKLAESTAILLNVSEFQDATAASEALISTMQAFQYTADESGHVVDILNEVGNRYAVSSDGLAIALQDSASALMEGGNNLEQAVALVAAANRVVQDPNSVGSALRTISLRLRGTSVEVLEEIGEETDGVVESTSKLQEKIKALSGVDILTNTGDYKDTYTILKEIGNVWEKMSDIDQAALLELMAGKNRANTLSAILSNMTDLEGAYNDALKAEGSAMKENEAYLDSIQGRIDLFNNSVQTMWMNFIDSDVIKFFVDLGTGLIKLVDNVGVLTSAFTVLGGIFVNKNWGSLLFGDIESTTKNIKKLQDAVDAAKQKWESSKSSKDYEAYQKELKNFEAYKAEFGFDEATNSVKKLGDTGEETFEQLSFNLDNVGDTGDEVFEQLSFDLGDVEESAKNVGDAAEVSGAKMAGFFDKAKIAASGLWVQIKQLAKSMLAMYAVSAVIDVLSDGISWATEAIKDGSNSAEALKDKYEEASDKLSECESELRSLESELKTVNDQIEELMAQGTPTYAEQEELERLQSISEELERQIALKQTLQGSLQTGVNSNAVNAGNAYLGTSFDSEKSKTARQDEAEESGKTWGKGAGLAIGAGIAMAVSGVFTGGTTWAAALPTILSGAGIGAMTGDVVGGVLGTASESVKYNQEQTVEEAIATMDKSRDKLIKARDEAYEAYVSDPTNTKKMEEYESAAQALSLYDAKMADHITQMSQYYNTITSNWDKATVDQKEAAKHYGDLIDKYNITMDGAGAEVTALDRIFGENASDEIQTIKEQILDTVKSGEDFDFTSAINGSQELKDTLDYVGLSAEDVKNYFTQIGEAASNAEKDVTPVATYSDLLEDAETYKETLLQTSEIIVDNTKVTQEYKDSLIALVGSEAEVNKYFDETNKLVVKDAKGLNNLVQATKKNVAANVSLAKSQARLQYYRLFKQMQSYVTAEGVVLKGKAAEIKALYQEMNALERTIAKYSRLEEQLLDTANAYNEFEKAQEIDSATDYVGSVENWISALGEAFNTAELGTESAQVAIKGLVPESVYKDLDTVDEKMAAIYSYFKTGKLAQYVDIQFDEDGAIQSAEMKLGNLRKFIEDGLTNGTLIGSDWQHFDLSKDIDSLAEFADAMGVTKEVAFAFIEAMEDHDIEWLNGDYSSIFEDILPDNLANDIYENTSALADLAAKLADGEITAEEYTNQWNELNKVSQENAQKARENASAWIETSSDIEKAKGRVQELSDELETLHQQGASDTEIKLKTAELNAAEQDLTNLVQKLSELETMDPVILQIALDQAQSEIDEFEENNSTLLTKVEVIQDKESGEYTYEVKAGIILDESEKKKLEGYLEDINAKYSFENALGEDITTTEHHLQSIKDITQNILDSINDKKSNKNAQIQEDAAVDNIAKLTEQVKAAGDLYNQLINGNVDYNNRPMVSPTTMQQYYPEFDGEIATTYSQYHTIGEGEGLYTIDITPILEDGTVLSQDALDAYVSNLITTDGIEGLLESDTNKLIINAQPGDYDEEYWNNYQEKLGEVKNLHWELVKQLQDAESQMSTGTMQASQIADNETFNLNEFFTTTIPEKWDEFWNSVGVFFDGLGEEANVLKDKLVSFFKDNVVTFITETIPNAFAHAFEVVANFFTETIPDTMENVKTSISEFFATTLPEAWNNFWTGLSDGVLDLIDFATNGLDKFSSALDNFLDNTLPEAWNNFWDSVGEFVFETIPYTVGYIKGASERFWNETVPQAWDTFVENVKTGWNDLVEDAKTFVSNTIDSIKNSINNAVESAKQTIENLIQSIDTFVYETWPSIKESVFEHWNNLKKAIGDAFADIVNGVEEFLNVTLPSVGEDIRRYFGDLFETARTEFLTMFNSISAFINVTVPGKINEMSIIVGDFLSGIVSSVGSFMSSVLTWIPNKIAEMWNSFTAGFSAGSSGGSYSPKSGRQRVDGTAHARGTAHKSGDWGLPKSEHDSLVGELGTELVVDPQSGRYYTVGDAGAEFVDLPKGAIIFNHEQTKSLLDHGYVTSRGKAYAEGNAHVTIWPNGSSQNQWDGTGYDSWDDPTWDASDALGNAAGDMSDAANDAADSAEQIVDFIEMKLEEIEAIIEKTTTKIANFLDDTTDVKSKDELYDELVKAEQVKSETYLKAAQKYDVQAAAALSGVPQKYQEMARNGAIAIKEFIGEDQVEIADKIQEYRDWAAKADEAENGHLEAIAAISAHRVEQLEDIATDFENIISISKSHSDLLQAEMDFIEESGNRLSESYYEELKKHSQKQLDDMQDERVALQKILDDAVAAGDVIIGSDDWYSMLETIYEVDQEIIDCKTSLEEFQNAINELHWDNFDKFITEIDNVNSELSNLYDLVSDDDKVVDDMGNWTDEGITALGLLAQQMENAQFKSEEYGKAIAQLKRDYANGLYSTDEYNEKLADLTESQYDAIKSYEDAKDAIVDLNKTRAEAVKKYMQDEIDKYGELIEKKKESLNTDKEARDFEKQVQESNQNIKDIERQIAALQGNTSSSAMAQIKRLEAELLKAREERNDLYYDHSIEKQQEALDKELEDYTKNKEDQMEALDEYLKKEEQVIADSFDLIAENTKNIYSTLVGLSEEYGVSISDTVATPWINATNAIGIYEGQLNTSVSATTANLEILKQHLESLQAQADKTAESIVAATHSTVVGANDGHQTSIKGYAKGSNGVEYDQWAILDELGEELQLVPNKAGRLDYIKKGTTILNNTLTERLIDLAMDPTSMLENNRPVIGAPGITTTNNTFTIDASVGTLLHVEHLDGSNPADVAKLVDKAWEKKMQTLNNSIKKFTR